MTAAVNPEPAKTTAPPRSLYAHIPFCLHHCWYCDFAVVTGRDDLADRYLEALDAEWRRQTDLVPGIQTLQTVFVGGGTPTQLIPDQLTRLFEILRGPVAFASDAEVSIEANPEGFTPAKLAALVAGGVKRVSLGGQSFQPRHLAFLERRHTPSDLERAIELVQSAGLRCAVDLIFGLPDQKLADWQADLEAVCRAEVGHVSTYGLTYEKGTRLWRDREKGSVLPLANETEAQMYELALDLLTAAGFESYEISNFARPGQRCRHNEVYWANDPCFGIGLGAARYLDGTRSVNTRSLDTYLERCQAGLDPVQSAETLDP
ncbi:MAG TPA: radical SAM family heme chaperone HemW, partial [Gemmatales bacterium]|nr:radical SAM family heme chaperone HemW [Gemmatales bacterium]